jgi:N-acetylmuramoyl-L-alanine amidase
MSVRGVGEVEYNDRLTSLIADTLAHSGYKVVLTQQPDEEMNLDERINRANTQDALALLSIHHDSAQLLYLDSAQRDGKKIYRTKKPIRGYSVFVSGLNPKYGESLKLAGILGEALLGLGRGPTLHHAETIKGENRPLLDKQLGIYRFDSLKILRKTNLPAVLLEFGVLVDSTDEAYVADEKNQKAFAGIIASALYRFRLELKSDKKE